MLIMLSPRLKYTFCKVYTMRKPLKAEKKLPEVRRAKKTDFSNMPLGLLPNSI